MYGVIQISYTMHIRKSNFRPTWLILLAAMVLPACQNVFGQTQPKSFDLFMDMDLQLSDMNWYRQYDVALALMPGFTWDMGNHWRLTSKFYIPLVNQISIEAHNFRPSILALSKEMKLGDLYIKGSGGLFTNQRYGLDVKAFLPVAKWFAFECQIGLTGRAVYEGFNHGALYQFSNMSRLTGTIGGDIYLSRWNTQLRGTIGRYVYEDYGVQCEAMRHFRHTTVSLFGRWSNRAGLDGKLSDGLDAGFSFTTMLPPYRRANRYFHIRPVSNFSLEYQINAKRYINNLYRTDAEENMRDGWFSRDLLDWGSHTMEPDFTIKGQEASK